LVCFCGALLAAEAESTTVALKPVKTWADLYTQPAIELDRTSTARLGVQTLSAPRHSGVLLYCMTEAYEPDDDENRFDNGRLGPFKVEITPPGGESKSSERQLHTIRHEPARRDYGRLVFAQIVALNETGVYTVELKNEKDALVASVKIECIDAPFHSWSALAHIPEKTKTLRPEGDSMPEADARTAAETCALPKICGGMPILYSLASGKRGPKSFEDDDPLPILPEPSPKELATLTPAEHAQAARWLEALGRDDFKSRVDASAGLRALGPPVKSLLHSAAGRTRDAETLFRAREILAQFDGRFPIRQDGMTLTLHTPIAFADDAFQELFMARWWVNDRPVAAKQMDHEAATLTSRAQFVKEALLRLHFDAAGLGAKTGDKIGVQLLFCPDGTKAVSGKEKSAQPAKMDSEKEDDEDADEYPERFPVLSNRIEFTAP
jgi:hypothetical protein